MNLKDEVFQKTQSTDIRSYFSPSRINLIGEHVDYRGTGGSVMPAAISLGISACASKSQNLAIKSFNFPEEDFLECELNYENTYDPNLKFLNLLKGAYLQLKDYKHILKGITIVLNSDIPVASGLSSSASLEVLILTVINDFYDLELSPLQIAKLAQKIENEYLGLQTGIMDQTAIACGQANHFLYFNTEKLDIEYIPAPKGNYKYFIISSNKKRELISSAYNQRVKELIQVAEILRKENISFDQLNDLCNQSKILDLVSDNILRRRLKHVLSEIQRVEYLRKNLPGISGRELGEILNDSHFSLRDDYETSCLETDFLHFHILNDPKIFGGRIIGAGFGGCLLFVASNDFAVQSWESIQDEYQEKFSIQFDIYDFEVVDATRRI